MQQYAIVINLDYASYPYDECRRLWAEITERMVHAGFRTDGRLFTTIKPEDEACELARQVVDSLECLEEFEGRLINDYIKEFYGYNHSSSVNLLLPPVAGIEIEEG